MARSIIIKIIPHKEQRYDTCGDYWLDESGDIQLRISELGDSKSEMAVLIHELVELGLVLQNAIPIEKIDDFDTKFEKLRGREPTLIGEQEPGDMVSAPYHREHVFATKVERMYLKEARGDWATHESIINNLK